jgi:hypothetical protein
LGDNDILLIGVKDGCEFQATAPVRDYTVNLVRYCLFAAG